MSDKLVIETQNDHTLTVVRDAKGFTLRIAKNGHNRAIAKITGLDAGQISEFFNEEH